MPSQPQTEQHHDDSQPSSPDTSTNREHQPDLEGNMFPVGDEVDIARLEVTGQLPDGLRGSFVRNGPNPLFQPVGRYHMFDGDGMLHGVTFDGGGERRTATAGSAPRGCAAEVELGPGGLPRARRRHELPRRVAGRRRRAGEEPGQHPHHPPRRSVPGPVGGRAAHRGHAVARHRRRVRLRRAAHRGDDRAPPPRPAHRRDVLLRLLGVRTGHPLLRRRRRRSARAPGQDRGRRRR